MCNQRTHEDKVKGRELEKLERNLKPVFEKVSVKEVVRSIREDRDSR
jgi:hypothetical protein